MPTLYTLAYPEVTPEAGSWLETLRREHDTASCDVVAAHFTLVFACAELHEKDYVAHVVSIAAASAPVAFACRYAMLAAANETRLACVYLVPDEGYSALSRLHDRLYGGILAPFLRLDIPYVPHLTVGTMPDRSAAKALCDRLNAKPTSLEGRIPSLTVAALRDGKIENVSSHALGG